MAIRAPDGANNRFQSIHEKIQERKTGPANGNCSKEIVSEMMTTYFPTLLLTTITFATTFFKPYFFEAALSVNLTTMLVKTS